MDNRARKYKNLPFKPIPPRAEEVEKIILEAASNVHATLGPGLLESVYETCFAHELRRRGLKLESQITLPIIYHEIKIESGLHIDMLVEKCVIIEIKAGELITSLQKAQLLTCLKLSDVHLAVLINFNVIHLRDGISRVVN